MSDPSMIKEIMAAVTIPVMAKARIGHFVEAQILEAIGCDFIDESEVLTPADDMYHIDKMKFKLYVIEFSKENPDPLSQAPLLFRWEMLCQCQCLPLLYDLFLNSFNPTHLMPILQDQVIDTRVSFFHVSRSNHLPTSRLLTMQHNEKCLRSPLIKQNRPFVCGAKNLGEAMRRILEGASMIRTKGAAGTGDVVQAVKHNRTIANDIEALKGMDERQLIHKAGAERVPLELLKEIKELGRLPVVNFAAGGVATPADAALMMQLGCDGVFVGSGIFKSGNPAQRARAIVQAVTHYEDPLAVAAASENLGEAMVGINCDDLMGTMKHMKLSEVPE